MSDINIGNLYEMNKQLIDKEEPLADKEIKKKLKKIRHFFLDGVSDRYFMLLNRETYNFTLFDIGENKDNINPDKLYQIMQDLEECLNNRGKIISIELTKDEDAFEIWIHDIIQDEKLVYYLFPYDQGVIN